MGSRWRLSQRQCARDRERGLGSAALPEAILPASVALSSTSVRGARPAHSNIIRSPAQKTSALSQASATQKRALGCGKVATSSFSAAGAPAITASKLPKSTWAVPGAHSSSR